MAGTLLRFYHELIVHLCVTPGSHLYVHHSGARDKWSKDAFMAKEVQIFRAPFLWAMDTCSTQVAIAVESSELRTTAT